MRNFAAMCILILPVLANCKLKKSQDFEKPDLVLHQGVPNEEGVRPDVGARRGSQNEGEKPPPIDLDKDFVPLLVALQLAEAVRFSISPFGSDASIVIRTVALMANAFFDAIAPYHPTAIGIYSDLGRRPPSERTDRHRNIALMYCSLRVLANVLPDEEQRFVALLHDARLDPSDIHESKADPIGIGNICGRKINEARDHDGMNSKGDIGDSGETVSIYNRKPFRDYTQYKPVNSFYKVIDPRRWQPAVSDNNGVFKIQKYVTPQHGRTRPYSYSDVNQFQAKPHGRRFEGPHGMELYKNTTDEIIAISAALTDEQKMAAEFFDDKLAASGFAHIGSIEQRNLTYDESVQYKFVTDLAMFDASIAIWKEKSRWNAVRPFTAIRYLYGDSLLTAYGGKGRGTVNDIPATAWSSYMPVADHPEYPSTSASMCAAFAESSRIWFGDERTLLDPATFTQGSSRREPGITPRRNIFLNFPTWNDFDLMCGSSRLWGGVHFVDAVEEGRRIGKEIGKLAAEFVRSHVYPNGGT